MNRAGMLRIAACGIIGLGAALLIAALLLSTYTSGKIKKIPLTIDESLVSDGTGTALDPASLSGDRFIVDKNVPLVSQQQITVESPANADVVTLQVGTTVRRSDKQQDNGLLLAMVDTVTLNRSTAMAVSDDTHPGGSVQKPRSIGDEKPSTNVALPHDGLSYRFPFDTEKKTYPYFDPIAQKAFDANYDGEDDVNGLTTYRFTQNVGYDADGKLVEPIKYASLYDDNADGEVTARASLWGLPGPPDDPVTMTRYYAAQRTFWVDPVSGTIVRSEEHANHYYARDPLQAGDGAGRLQGHLDRADRRVSGRRRPRRAGPGGSVVAGAADQLHRGGSGRADRRGPARHLQPARRGGADRSRPRHRRPRVLRQGRDGADARRGGSHREAARGET